MRIKLLSSCIYEGKLLLVDDSCSELEKAKGLILELNFISSMDIKVFTK